MHTLLPGTGAPVRSWLPPADIEASALQQLDNCAALPWTVGVAVMPDCHMGYGAAVGTVIGMRDAVAPGAVGVDIGCGMTAVRAGIGRHQLPDDLAQLRSAVEARVPVGNGAPGGHDEAVDVPALRFVSDVDARAWHDLWPRFGDLHDGVQKLQTRAMRQLGTLGGGNHFLELCVDDLDSVWLMLHSGSRGIGKQLADRHLEAAKKLPHNADLPDPNLAVFLADTPGMDAYWRDLRWAQEYARLSRVVMLAQFQQAVVDALPGLPVRWDEPISCHHNYLSRETFHGEELLITRKGAISTEGGRMGIIPGSMGTGSFIVQGAPNDAAFNSASHGAGRRMSRKEARRQFSVRDLQEQTAGVECRKDEAIVDEIPGAYKDLSLVMAQQQDLIRTVARLHTLLCVKG